MNAVFFQQIMHNSAIKQNPCKEWVLRVQIFYFQIADNIFDPHTSSRYIFLLNNLLFFQLQMDVFSLTGQSFAGNRFGPNLLINNEIH